MFYLKNWEKFCCEIEKYNINKLTAAEVLTRQINNQFIILKHDVETKPMLALLLAKIEHKFNIKGSFYVQAYLLDDPDNLAIFNEIQKLNHEVSYHYDVLDANNGDYDKAKLDFEYNLEKFHAAGFNVKTVCQHGNPVKKRVGYTSNRDFFRNHSIAQVFDGISDIVVNYKARLGSDYIYISDAGYQWSIISDPENNDRIIGDADRPLSGFKGIFDELNKGKSVIVSTHPHRWKKNRLEILGAIMIYKIIRYLANRARSVPFFYGVMNRFYYLAKKL